MAGQAEFLQAIQELERLGETNGNQLSMEEINAYFSDMKLEEKQLDFICNDLKKRLEMRSFRRKKILWMQKSWLSI